MRTFLATYPRMRCHCFRSSGRRNVSKGTTKNRDLPAQTSAISAGRGAVQASISVSTVFSNGQIAAHSNDYLSQIERFCQRQNMLWSLISDEWVMPLSASVPFKMVTSHSGGWYSSVCRPEKTTNDGRVPSKILTGMQYPSKNTSALYLLRVL